MPLFQRPTRPGPLGWARTWPAAPRGSYVTILAKTWVDAGFKNRVVEHGAHLGVDVEIITKDPRVKGFSVVKRRSVVERTLGWLMHHRRLVRDYEARSVT